MKFRLHYFLLIIFCVFSSCSVTRYTFENNIQNTGLDLSRGKWILNEIDCTPSAFGLLNPIVEENFKNLLHDSLFDLSTAKGIILPKKITLQPSKYQLTNLKKGTTGYDFFINIRAKIITENLGPASLNSNSSYQIPVENSNSSEVTIEVYNLKLAEIIYSKKVVGRNVKNYNATNQRISGIGSPQNQNSFSPVQFQTTADYILLGCFKKIIRDITSKSVKQK